MDNDRRPGRFLLLGIAHLEQRWFRGGLPKAFTAPNDALATAWLNDYVATFLERDLNSLTDALVVRQLQPWLANIGKRQVRSPKVYLRDSGTLHRLLGVPNADALLSNPIVGASWEGLIVEHIASWGAPVYFWRTQAGAEVGVVVEVDGQLHGVEIKRTDAPKVTPSMRHALEDLGLVGITVVHAGPDRFPLAERVEAVGAAEFLTMLGPVNTGSVNRAR